VAGTRTSSRRCWTRIFRCGIASARVEGSPSTAPARVEGSPSYCLGARPSSTIHARYPDGARTLDPIAASKKPPKHPNPKKSRYAEKIAKEAGAPEDVLAMLPVPKKKKKEIHWHVPGEEEPKHGKPGKKH